MSRAGIIFVALCTFAVIAIVLGVRWFGPHDLYEKDQPKTMAYTADMVVNGRYALPRDVIYQPATKPPFYNWVGATVIGVTGVWTEWTLKFPSVLGVLATGGIVFAMTRRAMRGAMRGATPGAIRTATPGVDTAAVVVGLLAVGVWFTFGSNVRHASVMRMSYLARPDMLLCALVTAAWACFTIAVEKPSARPAFRWAVCGWLCVAAAALTKGPAALMPIGFALLYPLILPRRSAWPAAPGMEGEASVLSRYARLWFPVGLVIVVVCVGGWFALAMEQDATHVRQVIWGAELKDRIGRVSPEGFTKPVFYSVMWFVTKAQPWGAIALGGLLACAVVPRLRRRAGPAALYLLIVLIGLSLPAGKRMDYLLPAYPPAAVLIAVLLADLVRFRVFGAAAVLGVVGMLINLMTAGHVRRSDWIFLAGVGVVVGVCVRIERRRRLPLAVFAIVPLLLAVTLGRQFWTKFDEARERWSDRAVAFTNDVQRHVGLRATVLVIVRGKHPLTTLLGRHPGSYLTRAELGASDYVILPEQPDLKAELLSEPVPMGFETLETRELSVLGLYQKVPVDRLVALQKQVGVWTFDENPYHAPNTIYRDE